MIFKSIELTSFGKFQNREISFHPTLNVVFGKNESGKSTLFQAIVGTLFGFKTDRDRYLPWSNRARYGAKLSIQANAESISLERNFTDDTVSWQQESDDGKKSNFSAKVSPLGRSSERALYLNKLQNIFGFSEADIFKHSLFIEQRSLTSLPSSETTTELKQIISNISEFKYDDILQCLEDKYFEITKINSKGLDKRNDRLLEEVQQQIRDLEEKVRRARHDEKRLLEIGKKVSSMRDTLSKKDSRLKKLSESIKGLEDLSRLLTKEEELETTFQDVKKKKGLVEKLLSQKEENDKESPTPHTGILLLIGVGFMALPFLYFFTPLPGILTAAALAVLGGISIKLYTHYKQNISMYRLKEVRINSQLEVLPPLEKLIEDYTHLKEALTILEAERLSIEKRITHVNWQSSLTSSKTLRQLVLEQEMETETLTRDLERHGQELQTQKQNYLLLSKGLESPFTLEEDLHDLKAQEEHLTLKAQALLTAKELLEEILLSFRKEHIHLFSDQTQELFQRLSSQNYHHVRLDELSLAPHVEHKLVEDELSMLSLSCGTQDQLFFSMKLALLNLLSPSKKLPLFLDDPFVNFDHERRVRAIDLLKEISQERQVFLFTYDPWYMEQLGKEAHIIHIDQSPTQTQ